MKMERLTVINCVKSKESQCPQLTRGYKEIWNQSIHSTGYQNVKPANTKTKKGN